MKINSVLSVLKPVTKTDFFVPKFYCKISVTDRYRDDTKSVLVSVHDRKCINRIQPNTKLVTKINSVKIPLKRSSRLFHETASDQYMQVNFLGIMKLDDEHYKIIYKLKFCFGFNL